MAAIQVAGTNGQLVGIDAVSQTEEAGVGGNLKGPFVEPQYRQRLPVLAHGGNILDVPRELPDQIASGSPHWHRQLQTGADGREYSLDLEEVRVGLWHGHSVANCVEHLFPRLVNSSLRIRQNGCRF